MHNRKKLTAGILIIVLAAVLLSGCSSGSSSGGEQDNNSAAGILEIRSVNSDFDNKLAIPVSGELVQEFETEIYASNGQLLANQEVNWAAVEAAGVSIKDGFLTVSSAAAPGTITITASAVEKPELSNQMEIELFKAVSSLTGEITVSFAQEPLQSAALNYNDSAAAFIEPERLTAAESAQKIINFKKGISLEAKKKLLKDYGAELIKFINNGDSAVINLADSPINAGAGLEQLPEVNYLETDQLAWITASETPNDPDYSQQWNLPLMDFPYLWQDTTSSRQIVAVIDTGISNSHPELKNNLLTGYNFYSDNNNSDDDNGHGTHVAGIIGARGDNGYGVAGAVWDIKLLPVKVLGGSGFGRISVIVEGIRYAAGLTQNPENPNPADVINLSLGTSSYSQELEAAVLAAVNEGVVVVASAGNYFDSSLLYPARFPESIAVGAVDLNREPAVYSNTGRNLDLLAPGGDPKAGIYSTSLNGGYQTLYGSSMAAPHVSALAALLLDQGKAPAEIENILRQNSIHPGAAEFSSEYGYGLINANFAYNDLQQLKVVVGSREGEQIKKAAAVDIDLAGGEYRLEEFPEGRYSVFAWIDANNNQLIDNEDYISQSQPLDFESQGDYKQNIELLIN